MREPPPTGLIRTKDTPITHEMARVTGALCQELGSKTNIRTRYASSVLISQDLIRFLGALCQEPGPETNIYFYYHTGLYRNYLYHFGDFCNSENTSEEEVNNKIHTHIEPYIQLDISSRIL